MREWGIWEELEEKRRRKWYNCIIMSKYKRNNMKNFHFSKG